MHHHSPTNSDVPTTPFERVASLSEAFPVAWGVDANASIESYLNRVGEDARPSLLRNLLAVEIEKRRAAGEYLQVEDYRERFKPYAALVRDVFLDLSSLSSSAAVETVRAKVAADKAPTVIRLGEYRLLGQLGRGGMGVVCEEPPTWVP